MREQFLGGFEDLGLGFSKKTKREAGEEREKSHKMNETGSFLAFIRAPGSGRPKPDPLSLFTGRLIKILMDLDQSNAPRALA